MDELVYRLLVGLADNAAVAALVISIGFVFNRKLARDQRVLDLERELEVLRNQSLLEHLRSQIQELYGPLDGIVQQKRAIYKIAVRAKETVSQMGGEDNTARTPEAVWKYFEHEHLLPLDRQAADLIATKGYLSDEAAVSGTFAGFFLHQKQFECLGGLWERHRIKMEDIDPVPLPPGFDKHVHDTLGRLKDQYHAELAERLPASTLHYRP